MNNSSNGNKFNVCVKCFEYVILWNKQFGYKFDSLSLIIYSQIKFPSKVMAGFCDFLE